MKYNYKLKSDIPGVTVTLTPNPLNAKVEMTEAAKREFALLLWTQNVVENYFLTGRFYLKSNAGKLVDGVFTENEPRPKEALEWLQMGERIWYEGWHGEKDEANDEELQKIPRVERIMQSEFVGYFFEALTENHCGDCTAFPASCTRCHAEEVLGINTLPVGKSVAHKMRGLHEHYFGTPEEKARTDATNAEFSAKYGYKVLWKPTFDESDKAAIEFFDEHQRMVKEQHSI